MSTAAELINESSIKTLPTKPDRPTHKVNFNKTFGVSTRADRIEIQAFVEPGPLTPKINPHYVFPIEETLATMMAITHQDNIYFKGHAGTGKTELVRQIAARLNYNVVQVNFDGHLLRSDLVGEMKLVGGSTEFRYGLIPFAFQEPGTILLLDEVDAVSPETAFVIQRALSEDRSFLLNETNEVITLHPQNVIMGTANTNGMGDDAGLYQAGTNVQNFSFLNRWATTIEVDYVSSEVEKQILLNMFPTINPDRLNSIVMVMQHSRTAFKSGSVSVPLTLRDSISWARKMMHSKFPMRTAKYSFLNRMPRQDAMTIAQQISRSFVRTAGDDTTFLGK